MPELEFIKQKKRLGIFKPTGYYFKGEFLNRYKFDALSILRKRVEHLSEKERNKTDEWKVIHQEYIKSCERTEKTRKAKESYYAKLNQRTRQRRIVRLNEKIQDLRERQNQVFQSFEDRIKGIEKYIKQLKNVKDKN